MPGHVYILASRMHGTLYTGVPSDLPKRISEHRQGDIPGFTRKYGVKRLVWHRFYHHIEDAVADEKRIKRWRRKWKLELIEGINPGCATSSRISPAHDDPHTGCRPLPSRRSG